jgi:hypothetical protein
LAIDLPENSVEMSRIEVAVYLKGESRGTAFSIDGMSKEEAIGRLTTILDRLREEIKYEWPTCPECLEPWSSHFDPEDDE